MTLQKGYLIPQQESRFFSEYNGNSKSVIKRLLKLYHIYFDEKILKAKFKDAGASKNESRGTS